MLGGVNLDNVRIQILSYPLILLYIFYNFATIPNIAQLVEFTHSTKSVFKFETLRRATVETKSSKH